LDPNGYLGYLKWLESHLVIQSLELPHVMLLPIRFIDFIQLLMSGNAYDGNMELVPKKELSYILDQIIGLGDPDRDTRSEYLDMRFESESGFPVASYNHRIINNRIRPETREMRDEYCLEQKADLDLYEWLNNSTPQGLPKSKNSGNLERRLFYTAPKIGCGMSFRAVSFMTCLECDTDADYNAPVQGVRPALLYNKYVAKH